MNTQYWNKFYSELKKSEPSSFAQFCLQYLSTDDTLLDVGCGDGRDSLFFMEKVKNVISIDNSTQSIENLKKYSNDNNDFQVLDINSLSTYDILNTRKIDVVYCRFLLHAIKEDRENILLKWASSTLQPGGRIMIESPTTEDETKPKYYDNHYRRFTNVEQLRSKLISLNFNIIYEIQGTGLSPYHDLEDPHLVRIIAEI